MSMKPLGRLCEIEGCSRPHKALGYCALHYRRWKETGTTDDPYKKTHCKAGHPWDESWKATCLICRRKSSARYERRNAWKRAEARRRK